MVNDITTHLVGYLSQRFQYATIKSGEINFQRALKMELWFIKHPLVNLIRQEKECFVD